MREHATATTSASTTTEVNQAASRSVMAAPPPPPPLPPSMAPPPPRPSLPSAARRPMTVIVYESERAVERASTSSASLMSSHTRTNRPANRPDFVSSRRTNVLRRQRNTLHEQWEVLAQTKLKCYKMKMRHMRQEHELRMRILNTELDIKLKEQQLLIEKNK